LTTMSGRPALLESMGIQRTREPRPPSDKASARVMNAMVELNAQLDDTSATEAGRRRETAEYDDGGDEKDLQEEGRGGGTTVGAFSSAAAVASAAAATETGFCMEENGLPRGNNENTGGYAYDDHHPPPPTAICSRLYHTQTDIELAGSTGSGWGGNISGESGGASGSGSYDRADEASGDISGASDGASLFVSGLSELTEYEERLLDAKREAIDVSWEAGRDMAVALLYFHWYEKHHPTRGSGHGKGGKGKSGRTASADARLVCRAWRRACRSLQKMLELQLRLTSMPASPSSSSSGALPFYKAVLEGMSAPFSDSFAKTFAAGGSGEQSQSEDPSGEEQEKYSQLQQGTAVSPHNSQQFRRKRRRRQRAIGHVLQTLVSADTRTPHSSGILHTPKGSAASAAAEQEEAAANEVAEKDIRQVVRSAGSLLRQLWQVQGGGGGAGGVLASALAATTGTVMPLVIPAAGNGGGSSSSGGTSTPRNSKDSSSANSSSGGSPSKRAQRGQRQLSLDVDSPGTRNGQFVPYTPSPRPFSPLRLSSRKAAAAARSGDAYTGSPVSTPKGQPSRSHSPINSTPTHATGPSPHTPTSAQPLKPSPARSHSRVRAASSPGRRPPQQQYTSVLSRVEIGAEMSGSPRPGTAGTPAAGSYARSGAPGTPRGSGTNNFIYSPGGRNYEDDGDSSGNGSGGVNRSVTPNMSCLGRNIDSRAGHRRANGGGGQLDPPPAGDAGMSDGLGKGMGNGVGDGMGNGVGNSVGSPRHRATSAGPVRIESPIPPPSPGSPPPSMFPHTYPPNPRNPTPTPPREAKGSRLVERVYHSGSRGRTATPLKDGKAGRMVLQDTPQEQRAKWAQKQREWKDRGQQGRQQDGAEQNLTLGSGSDSHEQMEGWETKDTARDFPARKLHSPRKAFQTAAFASSTNY
jgi:hypothetical protein